MNIGKAIIKRIKYPIIFLLVVVFAFSNFISFLPSFLQKDKLIDGLKITKAQAAALQYVGGTSCTGTAATYSCSLIGLTGGIDSAAQTDDLAVVVTGWSSTVNGNPEVTTAGYTELADLYANDTRDANLSVNWKIMGAIPDTSVTVSGFNNAANGGATVIQVWRGADVAGPIDVAIVTAMGNNGARPNAPSITPVTAGSVILAGGLGTGSTTQTAMITPAGMSNGISINGNGTSMDAVASIASYAWASGAYDPAAWTGGVTSTSDSWAAAALAIRPTPSGPDVAIYSNNSEGALADGGRSGQEIIVTGTNFGAGPSDGAGNAVKIGTYIVPNGNVSTWNSTTIVFTIPAAATVYGGTGTSGLIIRAGGNDDSTPLNFYIYPNITSITTPYSPLNQAQIGDNITVSGDHFGVAVGTITINTKTAAVGTWGETSLSNVKIPGQEGAVNITGKIQLTRVDAKTSNQYPTGNFTILAPSVSGSVPNSAITGQTVSVEFSGLGIDTDTGTPTVDPILKLIKVGQPTDCTASVNCIIGTSYLKIINYTTVSAIFDLAGAVTGAWNLVIVNMDMQAGTIGGFTVSAPSPTVTGINPGFGLNTGVANITYIEGDNFLTGATAKLTKGILTPINQLGPFTVQDYGTYMRMENGSFEDLTGKTLDWWNVVVTNPDLQSGSYGNETNSGFEIRSALPSIPANIYQFKNSSDAAQPPTTNIAVGEGIGGQINIYFRMDMEGGLIGENYFPQVEMKPVGSAFTNTFTEGTGVMYNGSAVKGWVNIVGTDGASYHWQARVRNFAGTSSVIFFGGNSDPNEADIYIDNSLPEIYQNIRGDDACAGAYFNVADLSASIKWKTYDEFSGAQTPPGSGPYATAQVDYKKSTDGSWTSTAILPRDLGIHQIDLSGLSPSTAYLFRMRSKDAVGNEKIYEDALNCKFDTTSTRPIKTVEFFIGQEVDSYKTLTDGTSKKYFIITLPESPSGQISVKSAFIEITGVTSAAASQAIKIGLLRTDHTLELGPGGQNFTLNSDSTTTPFTILFDTLAPVVGGNENMVNITTGATPYSYTLFLKGDGVTDVWLFSAKLIITYSYLL